MKKQFGGFYYFAYGSNTNIKQMFKRCPDAYPVTTATLKGYALEFRGNWSGRGVLNIRKQKGAEIEGVIWNVTARCIMSLDDFEGVPYVYDREHVEVAVRVTDKLINCFTYIMTPPLYTQLTRPTRKYFERCAKGYEDFGIQYTQLDAALDDAISHEKVLAVMAARQKKKQEAVQAEKKAEEEAWERWEYEGFWVGAGEKA